jgi:hypothetical protein
MKGDGRHVMVNIGGNVERQISDKKEGPVALYRISIFTEEVTLICVTIGWDMILYIL